ncbi:MAG: hypothetical protein RXN92_00330 [Thermoplasmatales archaeon]
MHNYKRGIIVLAVISLMIFTPLMAVFPLTSAQTTAASAQTTASSPIGTVTLNPSSGAFPGQIVTYTWSGVPVDLVPPVYVTVYLNGAPYSTGVASYSNGVLTGTFTMPNDNPGTVFNVALSYTDSAHNYGVSAQLSSTGTVNAYVAPAYGLYYYYPYTPAQVQFGVPYTLKADVNYTGITNVKTNFNGGSGVLNGYTNSTFNVSSKMTELGTNATTSATLNLVTKYGGLVNFTSTDTKQNITINTTAYNGGAASLALPASNTFTSEFTLSGNSITLMVLKGSISQTVNGQLVVFNLYGKYTNKISSPGNYTMLGSVNATSPSSLESNFAGAFSAAYYIKSIHNGSAHEYVNYTLSITINGKTSDSIVILKAQYLNTTAVIGQNSSGVIGKIYSNDALTLQSGYTFSSIYVALENPGISGTFVNNFVHEQLQTGNLTFSFANWTSRQLSSISLWYDNMTNIKIALNNQTLTGYLNMTITTNSYSPGVDYISPAIWNITNYVELKLTSPKGLKIIGSTTTTMQYNTTVLTSGTTTNLPQSKNFTMNTYFYDMLGYPYLKGFNVPYTSFILNYTAMDEISVVQQNFSWSGTFNMSVGKYNAGGVYSNVEGFNFTFSGKTIKLWINVTDVNPVMYGFTEEGNVSAWISLSGTLTAKYVSESYTGNFTPMLATFVLVNQWNYSSTPKLENTTYAEYTITDIYGSMSDAFITSGAVSFTSNEYYQGYINITGKSYTLAKGIELGAGQYGTSAGNITSVSGFGNTTILGWYNTTLTVMKVIPALYGLKAMNGEAVISAQVYIDNVSHSLTVDPYYQGLQNASFVVTILSNTTVYNNATFKAIDNSQNLKIVGLGYKGYLENLEITGTMSITDPLYNLTDNFAYSMGISKLPFFDSKPHYYYWNKVNFTFVSGDVPMFYNESWTTFYGFVASPIENLTLTPLANFSLYVSIQAWNYSHSYEIDGSFNLHYATPFSSANNSVFEFSSEGLGHASVYARVQNSYITLQGSANGITFTTNAIDVLSVGPIPVSGLTTSQFGSGTLTGTLNIAKLYPINWSSPELYPSQIVLSGQLTLQGFYANGTQYYTTINLMNTVAGQSLYMGLTTPMTAEFTTTLYSEMANTGMSSTITYPLLNGSGAMITGINNTMVAEIATLTGKYVNMSLSQLNAKIVGIYSELNTTYASIDTNFGVMEAQLSALNANVTAVSNGVATIQTSLGTIQASLNSLNAKIVAVNGTVATIKTDIGTINTSLASINAQLTSIQGNIATIQTSLGTIQGTVTSVNGSIATIKTQLGTLQTSVNGVTSSVNAAKSSTSNAVTFEVLILILVLITLVIAIGTMLSANRMVRKLEELKKQ